MPEQELRKLLEQVRNELDQVDQLDESQQDMLRGLATDIEKRLDPAEENPPLLAGLQDAIERFETSHPTLTSLISDAIRALSNAGI